MGVIYELDKVSFCYDHELILENINLTVNSGDLVRIVGANGSGKSTLLTLLTGERIPDSGRILFLGEEGVSGDRLKKLGYVAQQNHTTHGFPISGKEMVMLGLSDELSHRPFPGSEQKEKVKQQMKLLGIENLAKQNFHTLSGGQKQKVLLAKALVHKPSVLLLDEPTTGLDEPSRKELYRLLRECNEKQSLTILMITHEEEESREMGGRLLRMRGKKLEEKC